MKEVQIQSVKDNKENYIINGVVFVPKNEENSDYQRIQKWIVEGGTVEKEDLLAKEKLRKIAEIKSIRDQKNIEPITNQQAFLIDENGATTSQKSYFVFYTNRHQTNPASDPESIISRATELGLMPYFTRDLEGKKITVELTAEIAALLKQRIFERSDNNYKVSGSIEESINNAQNIEELQAIQLEE